MSEAMKIHKLYANTLELKLGSHEAACYDIHAHLRGPVTPEDVAPLIREIKWYDGYNQPHTSMPDVVFDSDVPICTFTLNPKCRALIPTGMVMDIPHRFLCPSASTIRPCSEDWNVTLINAEGVIDSDYCQEVFVPLHNTTNTPFKITHGDRIAQVEIIEYARQVRYVTYTQATPESQKTNRVGGFGSTGV